MPADTLIWHDNHNGEPPSSSLAQEFFTPIDKVYARNHGDIPLLDERTHVLELVVDPEAVEVARGMGCAALGEVAPRRWSMEDIKRQFSAERVTIALEVCAFSSPAAHGRSDQCLRLDLTCY